MPSSMPQSSGVIGSAATPGGPASIASAPMTGTPAIATAGNSFLPIEQMLTDGNHHHCGMAGRFHGLS